MANVFGAVCIISDKSRCLLVCKIQKGVHIGARVIRHRSSGVKSGRHKPKGELRTTSPKRILYTVLYYYFNATLHFAFFSCVLLCKMRNLNLNAFCLLNVINNNF